MAKLWLVRHGETALNSVQRYWGKTDVPLGEKGLKQGAQLKERLASEKLDFIYSSQLQRAVVTAQTIASAHTLEVTVCPELNEIDFGEVEGLNYSEVQGRFPNVARMWQQFDPTLTYPGGESLPDLELRVAEFRNRLLEHVPGDTILVVAHSGILRSLICQLLKMDGVHRWNLRLDLASISLIETHPETAILSLLNDTSHLKESK